MWVIPRAIIGSPVVNEGLILILSAAAPITFAIAIVRYQVMDIDILLNRSTVYALVLGGLLGVYALVVALIAGIAGDITIASINVPNAFAAIVVALLFQPARNRIQQLIDMYFFRIKYNYREIQRRFTEQIKHCLDDAEVAELVVKVTDEFIHVDRIGFFVYQDTGNTLQLVAHRDFERLSKRVVHFDKAKLNTDLELPLALSNALEQGILYEVAPESIFERWQIAMLFPIVSAEMEVLGFLALSHKKSGFQFHTEDIDLLRTMTVQAGLAIVQNNLRQKILLHHAEAERLRELNNLKSYFVSSVSHELKTPLTSIRMFAELLQTNPDLPSAKMQEYLRIIEGESDRLARHINSVLNFASIERGKKEYIMTTVDVNEIIQSVVHTMQYQFAMHKTEVQVSTPAEACRIWADADAIAEALINLISNAIKYSPEERRYVGIVVDHQPAYVSIRVDDKGFGIASENIPNIFTLVLP